MPAPSVSIGGVLTATSGPPAAATGRVKLRILQHDTTEFSPARYLSADGATGLVSKALDGSSLSFTANALEAVLAADQTTLEDTFVVAELDVAGVWTEIGTPYMLAPGSGTVLGSAEGSAKDQTPVAVGALQGLAGECLILPTECDKDSPTIRYAGGVDGNLYIGWMSKGYDESGDDWHDADIIDVASGDAKHGEPEGFQDDAAEWVRRDTDEGALTLLRFGTFTLAGRRKVTIEMSADEEAKVYVDGPNMGCCVLDSSSQETGYTDLNRWARILEPGTYRVSGEFSIISSDGGDGTDGMRLSAFTTDTKNHLATVLLRSDADTRVRRQPKTDPRPGMSLGETVRRLLDRNVDLGVDAATILHDGRDFTDADDSSGAAWKQGEEWTWPVFRTTLASALADMSEDCDMHLDTAFSLRMWNDRGSDRSSTVSLNPGSPSRLAAENIEEYGWDSEPHGPTGYAVESMEGWDIIFVPSVENGTRRRLGTFESGASGSIGRAKKNARAAIRQTGRARRYYRAQVLPVAGARPGLDFYLCDIVHARGYRNLGLDLEVTAWGWSQDESVADFTVELGEV